MDSKVYYFNNTLAFDVQKNQISLVCNPQESVKLNKPQCYA